MQKTTVKEYMSSESAWMGDSLRRIEELFKLGREESELDKTVKDLHAKIQELNEKRDELAAKKKAKLTEFESNLSIWVAEDKMVTEEWEQSE
jgi:uncharacterized protein YlxW (UPF0749 family)